MELYAGSKEVDASFQREARPFGRAFLCRKEEKIRGAFKAVSNTLFTSEIHILFCVKKCKSSHFVFSSFTFCFADCILMKFM